MTEHKCRYCGNTFHWNNAFSKFGYDDGEGSLETRLVAQALQEAGYTVQFGRWAPHNTLIYSIWKEGIEYMPTGSPEHLIGYDDPKNYLPQDIRELLDRNFPPVTIFRG